MGYVVRTPEPDPKMENGTLFQWFPERGGTVEEGEALAEIGTEATTVEVNVRENGVLRRTFRSEGETVAPEDPIGIVADAEENIMDLVVAARETGAVADGGRSPPREATARSREGMTGTVRTGGIEQDYGDGSDPSPVDLFLGSLAACLSLSIRYQAEMRDVPLGDIDVETDAEPESGSVESIGITVRLDAPETDESTLDRIVEYGERSCHVAELLREDLPVEVDWKRTAR